MSNEPETWRAFIPWDGPLTLPEMNALVAEATAGVRILSIDSVRIIDQYMPSLDVELREGEIRQLVRGLLIEATATR